MTRITGSAVLFLLLTAALFLGGIAPARAPLGGKKSLGGRTIASLQEEDFDKKLMQYRLCYGVHLQAKSATQERRRVCKAMLVHRLELSLAPGIFFQEPVSFECVDTALGKNEWYENDHLVVALKPNAEDKAIDLVFASKLSSENVAQDRAEKIASACHFLADCRTAMAPGQLSLRKVGSCFFSDDTMQRELLLDMVGRMLFRVKDNRVLYSQLLERK